MTIDWCLVAKAWALSLPQLHRMARDSLQRCGTLMIMHCGRRITQQQCLVAAPFFCLAGANVGSLFDFFILRGLLMRCQRRPQLALGQAGA